MRLFVQIAFFFFYWTPFFLASADVLHNIEKKIKAKGLKKSSLGIVIAKIQPDNTGQTLYTLNGDQLFIPASLAKIATLSALYDIYPPSYSFQTLFLSSAPIQNGILKGHLILKGGGDSSFTSESLWKLINILIRSGIKQIEGNLLIDDNLYTKEPKLPYSERSYYAPTSASSFNWNSVGFFIRPGLQKGKAAQVFLDPENTYIQIINKVKTGKKNKILIKKKSVSKTKELFEIKGEIDGQKEEIVKYRNITQPALWFGYNSLSFLKQRGVELTGQVKKGMCSGSCKTLAKWESRALDFQSYNMMKYSSNFVTRMLVSHIPLLKGSVKGDLKEGMKWIRDYLKNKQGIKQFTLKEPSGLDRKNRFQPKDLLKILINSRQNFYGPEMLSSYPLAGGKGTLRKRFQTLSPSSHIRAKTGSLYGVLALAGFAESSLKKEKYAFVFLFNGKAGQSQKAEELFDETLLSLLK